MSDLKNKLSVSVDRLQYVFDEAEFADSPFNSVEPCCGIIGQDRALSSVELGLEIPSKGYNIFVTGMQGTGRTTAVKHLVEEAMETQPASLRDICYVNNFKRPEAPTVLYFAAGDGRKFMKAIAYLVNSLIRIIPKIFSGENYRDRRGRILKEFETRQRDLFREFERKLKEKGFALVQVQYGPVVRPDLHPVVNEETVSLSDLEKAVDENTFPAVKLQELKDEYERLSKDLEATSGESKKISMDLEKEMERLDTSIVVPLINDKIVTLKNLYEDKKIRGYLDSLNQVLIEELDVFRSAEDGENEDSMNRLHNLLSRCSANLLVDNSNGNRRPIVIEDFPTFKNLFGTIERVYSPGAGWQTDFTHIRGGSLLQANGGYLVLHAIDIFGDPQVWPMLKRTLRSGQLVISSMDTPYFSGSGLKPEAIDIDVKVILIGESRVYDLLYRGDDDFKKVFKIKAEFDNVMNNDSSTIDQYVQFAKKIVDEEKLLSIGTSGMAAITEHGVKLAGRRDRLSTRFTNIADLVREASWVAAKSNKSDVDRAAVKEALELQKRRVNLVETKVHELFERDVYLIDVRGWEVAQINGLSVYDLGEYSFGRPTRITASLSVGSDGVINIEREAALSGRIHDKGVLILAGFMRHRFGRRRPLVLSASLCFEQSYSGVDGDSASSTEIYALLSALSGKPIHQALAVTGSVNQKGEIQPIGGVNQKIEGYFDTCMIDGLTGEQGVLIPKQNEQDLMLKDEVVAAVREGTFHIYAVSTIDEGIELLTGIPAGHMDADGHFPEGSINHLADKKLAELADIWQQYMRPDVGRRG